MQKNQVSDYGLRTMVLQHVDGRIEYIETHMNRWFMECCFPGWKVIGEVCY